jgi:iron complex outermembrane recepter protein
MNYYKSKQRLFAKGLSGCGFTLAALAVACSAQAETLVLEEVLVTAQKRTQSVQDVALTVNAISADMLENTATFEFSDLSKLTAGLNINGNNGTETEITLRGVGKQSTAQGDPTVAVFVDGIVQTQPGTVFGTMLDIERVEVMRGPQGTLYGKNSPAGAINIVTSDPNLNETEAYIEGTVGNWSTYETRGAVSVPLIENKLAVRLAGLYNESDGYVDNVYLNKDAQDRERQAARLKLLYAPTDNLDIKFGAYYADFDSGNTFALVGDSIFDYESYNDFLGGANDEVESYDLQLNWDLGNHTLTFLGGWQDYEREMAEDRDDSPIPSSTITIEGTSETDSYELRLASNPGGALDYMFGVFYQEDDTPGSSLLSNNFGGVLIDIQSTTESESLGIFTHNTWHINDQWDFTFGARYSEDDKSLYEVDTLFLPAIDLEIPFGMTDESDTFENVSGTLKLSYFATENTHYYISADTAYRSGGFNPFLTPDFLNDGFVAFDDETSQSFELGVKSLLWDSRLQLNAAVYYQDYEDFQVLRNAGADAVGFSAGREQPVQITANAPDATSIGAEAEFVALFNQNWSLSGSVSYNDTEIDDWTDAPCKFSGDVPGEDFDPAFNLPEDNPNYKEKGVDAPTCTVDGRASNQPRWELSLTPEYQAAIGSSNMEWFARALYRYASERNDPELESFNTLDLFLGLQSNDGQWNITAWGKNITEEEYLISLAGETADGQLKAVPNAPRSYGVTARWNF